MNLKKFVVITGLIALIVFGFSVASAQEPTRIQRQGIRAVIDIIATETGLESREIILQLQEGLTLGEIIENNGGDVQSVIDQSVASLTEAINTAITEGRITRERADRLLTNLPDVVTRSMNGELFPNRLDTGPLGRASERILLRATSTETGLRPAQILQQMAQGSTLAEIITSNGGNVENVVNDAVTTATEQINAAVMAERLGQEQADELITALPDLYMQAVNGEFERRAAEVAVGMAVVRQAAEQTGLEPREIIQQIREGKSLADVLTENGGDVTAFIDGVVAGVEERLNRALENGRLTQEQVDERLATFRERLTERINQPGTPAVEATPA